MRWMEKDKLRKGKQAAGANIVMQSSPLGNYKHSPFFVLIHAIAVKSQYFIFVGFL